MKIGKINRQSIGISGFTSVLEQYEGMPKTLYFAGKLPDQRPVTVAIIGSRKPTSYGKEVTHKLAYELAKRGVVIISGLAYGIDAVAHEAALEAGGTTIAVMANGLHRVYPTTHIRLAERIIQQGGALVTEQAYGVEAHKYHFLARNRIVSGLADAIIVTEATDRSGTFSTVTHAISQNKEVFAVPGPITSLLSAGPNRLLQEGAHLVLTVDDILRVIAPKLLQKPRQLALGTTPLESAILTHIKSGVSELDEIMRITDATASEILQAVTSMELSGVLRIEAGRLSTH